MFLEFLLLPLVPFVFLFYPLLAVLSYPFAWCCHGSASVYLVLKPIYVKSPPRKSFTALWEIVGLSEFDFRLRADAQLACIEEWLHLLYGGEVARSLGVADEYARLFAQRREIYSRARDSGIRFTMAEPIALVLALIDERAGPYA